MTIEKKRFKVLWVEPNRRADIIGGSMVSMLETSKYLYNKVNLHVLYYRQNSLQAKFTSLGIPYYYFMSRGDDSSFSPPLYQRPWLWKHIWRLLNQLRPEIVHINTTAIHALPWVFMKLFFDFKLVLHIRMDSKRFSSVAQYIFSRSDKVICICNYVAGELHYLGYRPPETVVIYDGVRSDVLQHKQISRAAAQALLGLEPNYRWLVLVGNISRWKGQHIAINAMLKWLSSCGGVRLAVVGKVLDSTYAKELEERAKGLGDKVRLVFSGTDSPGLWYRAATLVLHTSDIEPFGLVVPEALACQRPVVTCARGGAPEILQRLGLGKIATPETFEQEVLQLLTNKEAYHDLEAEVSRIGYPWAYEKAAESILEIYRSCYLSSATE
jgi:glycosyltransferase involved in cell wall biosynthesis